MEAKKLDSFVLFAMLLLALMSGFFFFLPISFEIGESRSYIGTMVSGQNIVKLRTASSPFWQDATFSDHLSHRDLIYTHADSSASISLVNGSKIALGEKTLFRLDQDQLGRTALNLQRGTIRAQLSTEGLELTVGDFQGKISGEGEEVLVSKDGADQIVSPLGGKLELSLAGNRKISLDSSDRLVLSEKKAPTIQKGLSLSQQFPSLSQHFVELAPFVIHFRYLIDSKSDDSTSNIRLQIARNPSFRAAKTVTDNRISIEQDGSYYWRVGTKERWSNPNPFTVSLLRKPILSSPFPLQHIGVLDPAEVTHPHAVHSIKVLFSWKMPFSDSFQLEVTYPDGELKRFDTSDTSLTLPFDQVGEYSWKVKARYKELSLESVSRKFNIDGRKTISAPTVISPVDGASLSLFSAKGVGVPLSWDFELEQSQFYVDLFDQEGNLLSTTPTSTKGIFLPLTHFGTYQWQVRTTDRWGKELSTSRSTFNIRYIRLKSNYPQQGVELQLLRPNQNVKFEWLSTEKAAKYRFEMAKEPEFKNVILTREVVGNRVEVSFPELGIYYWRTKIILPDGSFSFSEPIKMQIAPSPPPVAPDIGPDSTFEIDLKQSFRFVPPSLRFAWYLLDWIIQVAHAEELQTEAILHWKSYSNAAFYQVEIYRDQDGKDLLLSKKVREAKLSFENPGAGTYYWRVSIIDHWGRQGPFSNLTSMQLVLSSRLSNLADTELLVPRAKQNVSQIQFFSWKGDERVVENMFQIAFDRDFKRILLSRQTAKSNTIVKFIDKGIAQKIGEDNKLFWRVISADTLKRNTVSTVRELRFSTPEKEHRTEKMPAIGVIKPVKLTPHSFVALRTGMAQVDNVQEEQGNSYNIKGTSPLSFSFSAGRKFKNFFLLLDADYLQGRVFSSSYQQSSAAISIKTEAPSLLPFFWGKVGVSYFSIPTYDVPSDADGDPTIGENSNVILPFISLGVTREFGFWSFTPSISLGTDFENELLQWDLQIGHRLSRLWSITLAHHYQKLQIDPVIRDAAFSQSINRVDLGLIFQF